MVALLRRRVWVLLALSAAILAAGGAVFAATRLRAPDEFASLGRSIDGVELTDLTGRSVRWGDLNGRPRAVFFGFTNCGVICPVTVYELSEAADRSGIQPDALRLEFITIDPDRDTAERMRTYLSEFGPRAVGLTGSPEALARMQRAFEVTARRSASASGGIDHTSTVFLLDREGRVVDVVGFGTPPEVIERRLRDLVAR